MKKTLKEDALKIFKNFLLKMKVINFLCVWKLLQYLVWLHSTFQIYITCFPLMFKSMIILFV